MHLRLLFYRLRLPWSPEGLVAQRQTPRWPPLLTLFSLSLIPLLLEMSCGLSFQVRTWKRIWRRSLNQLAVPMIARQRAQKDVAEGHSLHSSSIQHSSLLLHSEKRPSLAAIGRFSHPSSSSSWSEWFFVSFVFPLELVWIRSRAMSPPCTSEHIFNAVGRDHQKFHDELSLRHFILGVFPTLRRI